MPLTAITYPNLVTLSRNYHDFSARTLELGNQLRLEAKTSARTTALHSITAALENWTEQANHLQEVMEEFSPDAAAAVASLRERWSLAQNLYAQYFPSNPISPPKATVLANQSALNQARHNIETLDQQAHENALLHLVTSSPPLWTPANTSTEFISAYESALKTAHWKQHPKRRRLQQLSEDLQAPLHEQAVRNFRRQSDRIHDVIEELKSRRRGRTKRQFREELQDVLANVGFGRKLPDSLPQFENWARKEFRTLRIFASRRYLPRLKRQLARETQLPTLVIRTYQAAEQYLNTLHEAYLEAINSLSVLTQVHLEISTVVEELKAARPDTTKTSTIDLVRANFDFRGRYPIARDWTNRVPYLAHAIDTISSRFHVAADHAVLLYQLRNRQRKIHDASIAILSRTNPRTNRRITNIAALEERELPHILKALRETELLLADYTAKYGSDAKAALTEHLLNQGFPAAHHVLIHGHANCDAFLISLFGSSDLGKRRPKSELIS